MDAGVGGPAAGGAVGEDDFVGFGAGPLGDFFFGGDVDGVGVGDF